MADITAFSPAMAAQILQTAATKSELLDNKLSQGASKAELGAKVRAIAITKDQISGEQKSAFSKAGFSLGGSAANVKASMRSEHLMARGMQIDYNKLDKAAAARRDKDLATGGALRNAAQNGGVNNVVTSVGDLLDKTSMGAHQADSAKIAAKVNDVAITAASTNKQAADSAKTNSQKFFDGTVEFLASMQSNFKAAMDKITQ